MKPYNVTVTLIISALLGYWAFTTMNPITAAGAIFCALVAVSFAIYLICSPEKEPTFAEKVEKEEKRISNI